MFPGVRESCKHQAERVTGGYPGDAVFGFVEYELKGEMPSQADLRGNKLTPEGLAFDSVDLPVDNWGMRLLE